MARELLEELYCSGCRKKLSTKQKLFETVWSGIYWCGGRECAYKIMRRERGEKLRLNDHTNYKD